MNPNRDELGRFASSEEAMGAVAKIVRAKGIPDDVFNSSAGAFSASVEVNNSDLIKKAASAHILASQGKIEKARALHKSVADEHKQIAKATRNDAHWKAAIKHSDAADSLVFSDKRLHRFKSYETTGFVVEKGMSKAQAKAAARAHRKAFASGNDTDNDDEDEG